MQNMSLQQELSVLDHEEKVARLKRMAGKNEVKEYLLGPDEENPAVYCGTYRKYNEGSLFGMWVDLVKCGDYDTFSEVCHCLHADEEDPELMYQDYECFPGIWYSESGIDEDTFDRIIIFFSIF